MNTLYAGFGRVNITPMMGVDISGYYAKRPAKGVLDELEANALALSCGDDRVLLIAVDTLHISTADMDVIRKDIEAATGVPFEAIFIHCTHIHSGGATNLNSEDALIREYTQSLRHKILDAASFALEDLKPTKMGWAVGKAPDVAFIRRFRMKDGSVRTNPGVGNPDIAGPIGEVDERVNVLRFDREGGETLVLANFGNHPDTLGSYWNRISADWPGAFRRTMEKAVDGVKAIFFNGAQGDVNHINVNHIPGVDYSEHAHRIGRVVAGAVMQVYDRVCYTDVDKLQYAQKVVQVPSNMPKPEDMPRAYEIKALYDAGREGELPYKGMENVTVVAEAVRMVALEHGPTHFPVGINAVAIGNIALIGIPAECFTGIGVGLKKAPGWDLVLPCVLVNGSTGYFPMQDAYDEGGYEARSSRLKAGVAELMIKEGMELLCQLRREKE